MKHLRINLQEGIVFDPDKPQSLNALKAIYSVRTRRIIIDPNSTNEKSKIIECIKSYNPGIQFEIFNGSTFSIDTWDEKLKEDWYDKNYS